MYKKLTFIYFELLYISSVFRLAQQTAALMIEKAWIGYRDKQMFRLLKHSVCAAVSTLTLLLKKFLLNDGYSYKKLSFYRK